MIVEADELRAQLEAALGCRLAPSARVWAKQGPNGVQGLIGFDKWSGGDIELWLAAPGCITRRNLRLVFEFVFGSLGCARCTAHAKSDEPEWISVLERIGFRREGVKRKAWHGIDLVMFGMLREECRWHGQG